MGCQKHTSEGTKLITLFNKVLSVASLCESGKAERITLSIVLVQVENQGVMSGYFLRLERRNKKAPASTATSAPPA